MVDHDQKRKGQPERRGENDLAVVQEQDNLEDGRREARLLAVSNVAAKVTHEVLVKPVVDILWIYPHLEYHILCG